MNCIPWDYPIPAGLNSTGKLSLCTSYEEVGYTANTLRVFEEAMNDGHNSEDCEKLCPSNCEETMYEYNIDTTELDTNQLCEDKETKKVGTIMSPIESHI